MEKYHHDSVVTIHLQARVHHRCKYERSCVIHQAVAANGNQLFRKGCVIFAIKVPALARSF